MDTFKLSQIDFGKTDGKNEAEQDNFFSLFYDDKKYYERLDKENYFIITGQKGAGKTLLANYFSKNKRKNKHNSVKNLYATDFLEEKLLSFSRNNLINEELLVFWKYVYFRELGELICTKIESLPFWYFSRKKRAKILRSLLNDIQLIVDTSATTEIESVSVGGELAKSPASIKGGLSSRLSAESTTSNQLKKADYYQILSKIEKEVFSLISDNEEFYLIYDDMDQLEEQMPKDEFVRLMQTMVYAADNINSSFRNKTKKARVIHVIRSDIKELMVSSSHNLIKIITDFGIEIDWYFNKKGRSTNHPLMKMLIHKIRFSVPQCEKLSDEELYEAVFDKERAILDYLLEYSFGRPREIIQFLNILKEEFPDSKKIFVSQLTECLTKYSQWLYEITLSEIKIQEVSEDIKSTLDLIKERGYKKFKYSKLEEFMNNNSKIDINDLLGVLKVMYKLGLIGLMNKNGTLEFYYRSNAITEPHDNSRFVTHYGLLKYLNLR